MKNPKLEEIITILKSIILQNQSLNIYESNMVNGLKFENNIVTKYMIEKILNYKISNKLSWMM